jgi:Ni/Co efflux regulator RcnB
MKNQLTTVVVAAAMLASSVASAQPMGGHDDHNQGDRNWGGHGQGDHRQGLNSRGCFNGERSADCGQRRQAEQHGGHRYVWRDGRYEDDGGAAVAGGILGFMLGAAIVGSSSDRDYYSAHRYDRGWRNRCRTAYPGFDYRNGTYLGQDGYRHYCTS